MAHLHEFESQDQKLSFRLWISVAVNVLITCVEFVGGFLSGSVALIADAAHNLSDVLALVLAAFARTLGRRPPTLRHTYGLKRFEVLSALLNAIVLLIITTILVSESVVRILHPAHIKPILTLGVAVFALAGNLGSALMLRRHDKGDLNVRSAFLHLVQDAISSLVVVIAAAFANTAVGPYLDPVAAILVGVAVAFSASSILRETLRTLLEGAPTDIPITELIQSVEERFPSVHLHHVHVWEVGLGQRAFTAHLDVENEELAIIESRYKEICDLLSDRWAIRHVTLQPESNGCRDSGILGRWSACG